MKLRRNLWMALFMMAFIVPVIASVSATTAPERATIVWSTGYDTQHDNYNPWTGSPAFGIALMYEPLFGLNGAMNDTLIPVIGTEYSWNADGTELTVKINEKAKWSDDEVLDADDVIYSYEIAQYQPRWTGMQDIIASMEKISATEMKFVMTAEKKFSYRMEQFLYTEIPIVPEHVWSEINDGNVTKDLDLFKNDWLNASFNEDWKVASGPYFPYFRDLTAGEEIYKLRDDWWGINTLHMDIPNYSGTPEAKYIGMRKYADNTAKDAAILTDEIDLHAGFYSSVWTALGRNDNIETWFGKSFDDYYLALGAIIEVAPNHMKFPFNQLWFRQALAYSIDYDSIEVAASGGYWNRARQGVIDNRSASHKSLYNESIQEEYGIDLDVAKAIDILNESCYQVDGVWYTDDVPVEFQGTLGAEADEDSDHAGFNIALGGYEILVPAGWTDVCIATSMWAGDFSDINITTTKREVDFWNGWRVKIMEGDFDMVMQCCTPHLVNDPYTVLGGWRGTANLPWDNASHWESPEYEALYQAFDTAKGDERLAVASQMQEILATELPTIVSHANGFWYLVNTKYWNNWPSAENEYQDAQTAYSINRMALKQRMYLGLIQSEASGASIPWNGFTASLIVGVLSVLSVQIIRRRKQN
ncbi:ABC transporter substrate-binding protein [Candidatus Lokiarchaeum ossiferum]|uniref:ABC transporter substrate-binding protein n=1 Tax=Candidatus Lokiarchaeum ossiferum TaxID=2951803 RepID=UPI00352D9F84